MADKPTFSAAMQQQTPFGSQPEQSGQLRPNPTPTRPIPLLKQTVGAAFASGGEPKKPLDISNLMSPPELPPLEGFHQKIAPASVPAATTVLPPLSPPISPFTKSRQTVDPATANASTKDPILFAGGDGNAASPQQPLFSDGMALTTEQCDIIDGHVAARPANISYWTSPPKRKHYEMALTFKSDVLRQWRRDPKGWMRREKAQLLLDRQEASKARSAAIVQAPKAQVPRAQASRVTKPEKAQKSQKSKPAPRPIRAQPAPERPVPARPPPVVRPTQPKKSTSRTSATPEPRSRQHGNINRDDKDFASIPDFCPPVTTLPAGNRNILKMDWKGNPLDITDDPLARQLVEAGLLHEAELTLAGNLRLDAATYLTSKRRLFERRVICAINHKEFRKTDAQQACHIDVNKASRLWTAYEKANWLNLDHFREHMQKVQSLGATS